jgi:hypothetical protein
MRIGHLILFKDQGEVIAIFGDAKLVKTLGQKYELRGGSAEDHTEAKEWISMFLHEAVVKNLPLRTGRFFL